MNKTAIKFIGNVLDPINRGWVYSIVDGRDRICLPYTTRVELVEVSENFEHIKILEGYYKGNTVKFPFMSRDDKFHYSFLIDRCRLSKPITLKLNHDTLKFGNFKCEVLVEKNILNNKVYCIKFPVRSNKILPSHYFDESRGGSRFSDTWFPLQAKDELYPEKYLHFGSISEGCLTVKYNPLINEVWNTLYTKLIHSRMNEDNLGFLTIK